MVWECKMQGAPNICINWCATSMALLLCNVRKNKKKFTKTLVHPYKFKTVIFLPLHVDEIQNTDRNMFNIPNVMIAYIGEILTFVTVIWVASIVSNIWSIYYFMGSCLVTNFIYLKILITLNTSIKKVI